MPASESLIVTSLNAYELTGGTVLHYCELVYGSVCTYIHNTIVHIYLYEYIYVGPDGRITVTWAP